MDEDFKELLTSLLAADPEAPLDDDRRQAVMYAMLALHPREHMVAIWKFADSITNEFKRSHLLHKLVELTADRAIEHDLAERIARSIPDSFWRFSALSKVASELLERSRQFGGLASQPGVELRERGLKLLEEVEAGLSSIPEDDDRVTVLWAAGLSLVGAGKLEWAESLASTTTYCPENTEVLLRSAKARLAVGQTLHTAGLAKAVAELAKSGTDDRVNRAFDLIEASELLAACGSKDEARDYLGFAAEHALASQDHDVDGCKCLSAVAIEFAKQGHFELARENANAITVPARRDYALQKIAELSPSG